MAKKFIVNPDMNPNPLKRKKQVHVDVTYEAYVGVRARAFQTGLTLQEMLDEFLRLIAEGDSLGDKLVERCYKNKLSRELDLLKNAQQELLIDEMDTQALYDMIEEAALADDEPSEE